MTGADTAALLLAAPPTRFPTTFSRTIFERRAIALQCRVLQKSQSCVHRLCYRPPIGQITLDVVLSSAVALVLL